MNIDAYKNLTADLYREIFTAGSLDTFKQTNDIKAIIAQLDALVPIEHNKRSTIKLYIDPNDANGTPSPDEYVYFENGKRFTTSYSYYAKNGLNLIKCDMKPNFYFNDIIEVQTPYHGRWGEKDKMLFHSNRFNGDYKMMLKDFQAETARKMTCGVLIGNFTFGKTGGYLGLKLSNLL